MKKLSLFFVFSLFLIVAACSPNVEEEIFVVAEVPKTFEELTGNSENTQIVDVSTMMLANSRHAAASKAVILNGCYHSWNQRMATEAYPGIFIIQEYRNEYFSLDGYEMYLQLVAYSPSFIELQNADEFVSEEIARGYLRAFIASDDRPLHYAVVELPTQLDTAEMTNPVRIWCGEKHQAPGR